jgi:hypothetical protein
MCACLTSHPCTCLADIEQPLGSCTCPVLAALCPSSPYVVHTPLPHPLCLLQWIGGVLKGNMNAQWGETRLALHLAAVVSDAGP